MSEPIHHRVLLVDDNPAVLRQVVELLPSRFDVVAMLEDGAGLSAAIERHRPDVVVLDISMPGANGFTLARELLRAGSSAKVVFLTVHSDPDYVHAAFAAGASAYVVKMRLALDMMPALESAIEGGSFVSPDVEAG